MTGRPIRVALDRNDESWTSQFTYMSNLSEELSRHPGVQLVPRDRSPDIVHLNYLNPVGRLVHGKESYERHLRDIAALVTGLDAALVVTEHGVEEFSDLRQSMYLDEYPRVSAVADWTKRQLSRFVGSRADRIIAISSMDRDFLVQSGFQPQTVRHVPHGVEESFFASERADEDFVLHVSKCSPHKNPEAVVETARRIDRRTVVVGGGWEEHYGAELAAIDSVELKGFVEKSELRRLYRTAGVFYFPSTYEPFGLPILEALAAGTPVVASVNSAAGDFDTDGVELVNPEGVEDHVDALENLLQDPAERRRRGDAARSFAGGMTWEHTAERTVDIYEELV